MKIFPVFCMAFMLFVFIFPKPGQAQMSRSDSIILKNRLITELRLDVGNVLSTNDFVRSQNTDLDGLPHYFAYSLRLANFQLFLIQNQIRARYDPNTTKA
jgi:hypothetical protein